MNLLLYSHYWAPSVGGVETITMSLAEGLSTRQPATGEDAVCVTVVTQTPAGAMDDSLLPFRVVRRPALRDLIRLIRSADLVQVAGPALLPLVLALLFRKPVVVEHHGFQAICPNGQLLFQPAQTPCPGHFMARRYHKCLQCNRKSDGLAKSFRMLFLTPLRRWLTNRATTNITPTDWLATMLRLNRMKTIYHGISPAPPVAPVKASVVTFAFQGRLVTTKGVLILLEAATLLHKEGREFHLKIVGDGPELNSMKTQAAPLNGRVEFLGHVADHGLDEVFSDVAAVVMPSLAGEVFGLVAAENMFRGKLLIVSNIGALAEVVGDTGLVFPTGDAAALALCMRRVLDDPSLAASLGSAARLRAMQMFNRDNMIESHVALYLAVAPE
jgi:glycosyltransferase involved in cell wall biosynthesis